MFFRNMLSFVTPRDEKVVRPRCTFRRRVHPPPPYTRATTPTPTSTSPQRCTLPTFTAPTTPTPTPFLSEPFPLSPTNVQSAPSITCSTTDETALTATGIAFAEIPTSVTNPAAAIFSTTASSSAANSVSAIARSDTASIRESTAVTTVASSFAASPSPDGAVASFVSAKIVSAASNSVDDKAPGISSKNMATFAKAKVEGQEDELSSMSEAVERGAIRSASPFILPTALCGVAMTGATLRASPTLSSLAPLQMMGARRNGLLPTSAAIGGAGGGITAMVAGKVKGDGQDRDDADSEKCSSRASPVSDWENQDIYPAPTKIVLSVPPVQCFNGLSETYRTGTYKFEWSRTNASKVFLVGSFNNWGPGVEMDVSDDGEYHVAYLDLPFGWYHYKFIVDGNWWYDILRPTVKDAVGNVNNVMGI